MSSDYNVADEHNVENNDQHFKEMSGDENVVDEHNVEVNDGHVEEGINEDYVASEDNFEDIEFLFSEEPEEMEWTKLLPLETLVEVSSGNKEKVPVDMEHEECEDSSHLYTPPGSDDDEEVNEKVVKFSNYKSGVGIDKFNNLRSYAEELLK